VGLLPFEEASRRLRISGQSYLGIKEIPVDRIVGSVDRSADFGRDFKPRRGLSRSRLASLRSAFPDGGMPAIEVFEVGPDVDVCQLVHTEQQRVLLEESGLSRARPDAVIEFTLLEGYTELREVIKAHGYDLARRRGALPTAEEVGADWYDTVYLPGLEAVRRASLPERYASWRSTDADLFLWVYQVRRDLRGHDETIDFDAAASHARQLNLGRRRKRHHLREGRRPLPQRGE
jgi:hypothetical protein